ncbi:MAG: ABC transporter ATP-binding protein [Candidatus Omnitrophota bacterium]
MIQIRSLTKVFKETGREVVALCDVKIDIQKGECVLIGGTSGSGKTTLLNVVGCLTRPTSGEVLIDHNATSGLPEHFLSDLRRRKIGFVFQQYHLFTGYTAIENVGMPLVPKGVREAERRRRAGYLLDSLGLHGRADFPVNELSGGEQQRVAIARALINDPDIIIADEPSSNIDAGNAAKIIEIFVELIRRGKTFLITAHNGLLTKQLPVTSSYVLENGRMK